MQFRKKDNGLSLIELLIVIFILGILSVLIPITISNQIKKARDARRKADFNLIQKGLEQYYDSVGCYPKKLPNCGEKLAISNNNFIQEIPCDPKTKQPYLYITADRDCSPYFKLYTRLERSDDFNILMVGCQNGCGPDCIYNFGIASVNTSLDYCQPGVTPTLVLTPSLITTPTPTPIQYVCGPASGPYPNGRCEPYAVPTLSECPKVYPNDPTCRNECYIKENRCKNAKGKFMP
jgi:general secretion pathway protein G